MSPKRRRPKPSGRRGARASTASARSRHRRSRGRPRRSTRCRPGGTRAGGPGRPRLRAEAKGGAVIAIARLLIGVRVALEIEPRSRHGQIGPQTEFVAGEIGEDVGAAADRFADLVEKNVGRLDDGRGDGLVPTGNEHRKQRARLVGESLEIGRRRGDMISLGVKARLLEQLGRSCKTVAALHRWKTPLTFDARATDALVTLRKYGARRCSPLRRHR